MSQQFMRVCAAVQSHRMFVDTPGGDDAFAMAYENASASLYPGSSAASLSASPLADAAYTYPLDSQAFPLKMYGEANEFANNDLSRVFATARQYSYDPAVLYDNLRLQDGNQGDELGAKNA